MKVRISGGVVEISVITARGPVAVPSVERDTIGRIPAPWVRVRFGRRFTVLLVSVFFVAQTQQQYLCTDDGIVDHLTQQERKTAEEDILRRLQYLPP